jgi:competence protein ComEA
MPEPTVTIDINSATAEEFDAVSSLAGHGFEIVRYRGERGKFTDVRQLDEVPGLAGKLGDADRALLSVDA